MVGKTALTLLFFSTFAANAVAMKSDPDKYYLDPEEIRHYVRDRITGTVMLKKRAGGHEGRYANINEPDVRLLNGQIPLYGIDNDIVAYIYLAYVVPRPLPTIDEVIKKAREISDARKEVIRNQETSGISLPEFDAQHFPYGYLCAYALIGINERCTTGKDALGLPRYILSQKEAEDAARVYYGSSEFELVKYIFAATIHGYEFTDGSKNIIVPLHTLSGHVYADEILTRGEIEADINEYRYTFDPERARKWVEKWKRRLTEHGIE